MTTGKQRIAYKPREVAALTGLSRSFVYQMIARGEIPVRRVGRAILVPAEWVEAFAKNASPGGGVVQ